jgi:hypothetical protein
MAFRTVILALREPAFDSEVLFSQVWDEMWSVGSVFRLNCLRVSSQKPVKQASMVQWTKSRRFEAMVA